MPETTVDTLTVTKHDTVKVTDENQLLFMGSNQVVVGGSFTYYATILYKITKDSEKNTLTVVVPEYDLDSFDKSIIELIFSKFYKCTTCLLQ